MSYAILGAGKVGRALATAFARQGIEVAIASRRPVEALAPIVKVIGPTVVPKALPDAVKAEIVFLAVPFESYKEVAKVPQSWQDKIVIDVTNAYGVPPEKLGNLPSSAVISQALPGASVVKDSTIYPQRPWLKTLRSMANAALFSFQVTTKLLVTKLRN